MDLCEKSRADYIRWSMDCVWLCEQLGRVIGPQFVQSVDEGRFDSRASHSVDSNPQPPAWNPMIIRNLCSMAPNPTTEPWKRHEDAVAFICRFAVRVTAPFDAISAVLFALAPLAVGIAGGASCQDVTRHVIRHLLRHIYPGLFQWRSFPLHRRRIWERPGAVKGAPLFGAGVEPFTARGGSHTIGRQKNDREKS